LVKSEGVYSIEVKELDDLVRLAAFSHTPILHHLKLEKDHIYFVQVSLGGGSTLIYYAVTDSIVSGKFVVYNILRGSIEFSDTLSMDTGLRHIPVLEILDQNVFPAEMLRRLASDKKESIL